LANKPSVKITGSPSNVLLGYVLQTV